MYINPENAGSATARKTGQKTRGEPPLPPPRSDERPRTRRRIDQSLTHVWMVRTFLKHSEEAEEDEDLQAVYRQLYDVMHALGPSFEQQDWEGFLKLARKKSRRFLGEAADRFAGSSRNFPRT